MIRSEHPKILITGATGFIGSNLTRKLIELNYETNVFIRRSSNLWRISDLKEKIKIYEVDITNASQIKISLAKIKPDVILHLASAGLYGGVSSPPKILITTNIIGTANLIEAARNTRVKLFINTGSSAEYGPKNSPMKESDSTNPNTFYSFTKLASTLYSQMATGSFNLPILTLRIFSPFGPYDDPSRLITYVSTRAIKNDPLFLSEPTSARDYIYISDVVDAYIKAIMSKSAIGQIINIGSGHQTTVSRISKEILKITKSRSKIYWKSQPKRLQDSPVWQADIKKAIKLLKWQPRTKIYEGLKKTVTWFRDNSEYYT